MALPKKKTPKSKRNKRRANSWEKIKGPELGRCPHCGELKRSHFVCQHCGWYKGRQVVTIKVKEEIAE